MEKTLINIFHSLPPLEKSVYSLNVPQESYFTNDFSMLHLKTVDTNKFRTSNMFFSILELIP